MRYTLKKRIYLLAILIEEKICIFSNIWMAFLCLVCQCCHHPVRWLASCNFNALCFILGTLNTLRYNGSPFAWVTFIHYNNCRVVILNSQWVELRFELKVSGFEFGRSTIELSHSWHRSINFENKERAKKVFGYNSKGLISFKTF